MLFTILVSLPAVLGVAVPAAQALTGTTTTTWDCCKPSCSWQQNALLGGALSPVRTCDKSNSILSNGPSVQSGCQYSGGVLGGLVDSLLGYSCASFQPIVVNSSLSYGFAGNWDNSNCCKCFKFTWTSGQGSGKSMVVQVVNAGGVGVGDFDIYTPGGGVGDFSACTVQYGSPTQGWGRQYGGVQSASACNGLPSLLQAGCHWRFGWAGGEVNQWRTQYQQVACPSALTAISGCA